MLPSVSVQREVLEHYQEQYIRARYVAFVEHRLLTVQDSADSETLEKHEKLGDLVHTMNNCDQALAEIDRLLKELK